jgi:hypothetical protein
MGRRSGRHCQWLETGINKVPTLILPFVHIALVCLLSLVLTGLPQWVAADEGVRTCAEQQAGDDDGTEDRSATTPYDAYWAARLCTQAPCPALPQEVAPPMVAQLSLGWSMESTSSPCIGAPQEVFQPPRKA